MTKKEKLLYDTIRPVTWQDDGVRLLDQRKLPKEEVYLHIQSTQALHEAIKDMVVRGAPAIGIAAAYGAVLAAKEASEHPSEGFNDEFIKRLNFLASARPTAINLSNALNAALLVDNPQTNLLNWANSWLEEDILSNKRIATYGAACFDKRTTILTHCNAGALATGGYGTALGVVRRAFEEGQLNTLYADETRPWNQGARLTLWELQKDNIPATLIADSTAASLMRQDLIDWVVVGADSICLNGDIANKVGTYSLAVLAKYHGVKMMVAAPTTTIDLNAQSGSDIVIEHRDQSEILPTEYGNGIMKALNPVFDITPAELISVIVTEKGVIEAPDIRKMSTLL